MSSASETKLGERAEKLLTDMPVAERDWEAMAARTVEKALASSEATPRDLFDAPLPAEQGEPGFERKETTAPKATVSLADLARASVKKKSDATKDIALESLAVASQARAQVDEIAGRVQAAARQARASSPDVEERERTPEAPALVAAAPDVAEAPPAPAPVPVVTGANAVVPPRPTAPSRGPWIVSGIAVLAAAAAIAISLRPKDERAPLVVNDLPKAAQVAQAEAPAAKPGEPQPAAEPATSPVPAPLLADPALAKAGGAAPAAGGPRTPLGAGPGAAPSGVAPEAIVLDEEATPEPAPRAAPAPSAKMVPAELPRTGLPDKPSAGAAYAAIGPFMGSARACVAGHDDPSTARIVFGSDGSVQSVSVSGPAAGTAAAACIENAFKKARVQPFANPTFSMSAPVRPQ
jgi:hypothetical protein